MRKILVYTLYTIYESVQKCVGVDVLVYCMCCCYTYCERVMWLGAGNWFLCDVGSTTRLTQETHAMRCRREYGVF